VLRVARKAAEGVFSCPSEPHAGLHDFGEIASLLNRMGMNDELEARIAEGNARASIILNDHREQALRLIAHLIQHGHVNEPDFLRLMNSR
jgi:hypothetical protein